MWSDQHSHTHSTTKLRRWAVFLRNLSCSPAGEMARAEKWAWRERRVTMRISAVLGLGQSLPSWQQWPLLWFVSFLGTLEDAGRLWGTWSTTVQCVGSLEIESQDAVGGHMGKKTGRTWVKQKPAAGWTREGRRFVQAGVEWSRSKGIKTAWAILRQMNKAQEALSCKTCWWLLGVVGDALWLVFPMPLNANSPKPSRGLPQPGMQLAHAHIVFFFFLFSFLLSPPHLPTQNPALKPLLFFYQDEKSVSLRTLDLLMSWQFQHDLSSPAQRQPRSSPAAGDCGMLPQWHLPGQINLEQNNAPYCSIACGCASHGHGLLCAAIDMPVFTTWPQIPQSRTKPRRKYHLVHT